MPLAPKQFDQLLKSVLTSNRWEEVFKAVAETQPKSAAYYHWDELRYRTPPKGLSLEEWWFATKFRRKSGMRQIPLKDKQNHPFEFCVPDSVLEQLHHIDRNAGALVGSLEPVLNFVEELSVHCKYIPALSWG